ncbi:MAG: hypothetical protein V3R52_01045 [Candidatus Neomarinimicrobiota bacterium]
MNKTVLIMLLLLFSSTFCFAHDKDQSHFVYMQNPSELINPDDFYEHMIIRNDNLSFLSNRFYNDPWKWIKIYQANTYIIDPNWIYPDNWLVIPDIYSDENGDPITETRSFTYESEDIVISDSTADSSIDKDNILDQTDKSAESKVQSDNEANIDQTAVIESETKAIESDLELENLLDNFVEDDTISTTSDESTDKIASNETRIEAREEVITIYSYSNNPPIDEFDEYDNRAVSNMINKINTYKDPNWIIGLFGGYPFGDVPDEEDNLAYGLLVGTPLRFTRGVFNVRLGAGVLGYDFSNKLYPGAGVLLSIALNELFQLSNPVQLQIHGTGFYVPDGELGTGLLISTIAPIGESPFNLGLYVGVGEYNNDPVKSNLKSTGLILQLII